MIGKKEYSTVEFARDGVTVGLFYNGLNMPLKLVILLCNVIKDTIDWLYSIVYRYS